MFEVEALLGRANLLLAQGRPIDAEQQLTDALRQDPDNDQAISLLARCKYELRQFNEGIALAQKAIQLAPLEGYYFYLLAFGYYQTDQHSAAQANLKKAVELNPYAADFFGLWSLTLIEERNFEQALEKANEGLAVNPENITCLNARSTALNKLRRVDDAIQTMQAALEQDPENHFTHTTVGWNYLEKGKHREAASHFREALRLQPNMESGRVGLKQALKSKIAPYRWLLQYSFWINNKGKNARWIIPVAIYIGMRVLVRLTGSTDDHWTVVGVAVAGIYILFAATSWIINPLANFFLLFHKDGKYALTATERISAWLTVGALTAGFALVVISLLLPGISKPLLFGGLVMLSLALPLGHSQYPFRFRNNSRVQWMSMVFIIFGLITFVITLSNLSNNLLIVYASTFIAYTWVSALSSR